MAVKTLMIKQNSILFICIFNDNTEIQVVGLTVLLKCLVVIDVICASAFAWQGNLQHAKHVINEKNLPGWSFIGTSSWSLALDEFGDTLCCCFFLFVQ